MARCLAAPEASGAPRRGEPASSGRRPPPGRRLEPLLLPLPPSLQPRLGSSSARPRPRQRQHWWRSFTRPRWHGSAEAHRPRSGPHGARGPRGQQLRSRRRPLGLSRDRWRGLQSMPLHGGRMMHQGGEPACLASAAGAGAADNNEARQFSLRFLCGCAARVLSSSIGAALANFAADRACSRNFVAWHRHSRAGARRLSASPRTAPCRR